jgi:hypothetical protein
MPDAVVNANKNARTPCGCGQNPILGGNWTTQVPLWRFFIARQLLYLSKNITERKKPAEILCCR